LRLYFHWYYRHTLIQNTCFGSNWSPPLWTMNFNDSGQFLVLFSCPCSFVSLPFTAFTSPRSQLHFSSFSVLPLPSPSRKQDSCFGQEDRVRVSRTQVFKLFILGVHRWGSYYLTCLSLVNIWKPKQLYIQYCCNSGFCISVSPSEVQMAHDWRGR